MCSSNITGIRVPRGYRYAFYEGNEVLTLFIVKTKVSYLIYVIKGDKIDIRKSNTKRKESVNKFNLNMYLSYTDITGNH